MPQVVKKETISRILFTQEADTKSAIRAIPYINAALQDPLKPSGCAASLSIALALVVLSYRELPEVSSKRDGLRATLYAFVAAKRTDEELKAMWQKLGRCTCKAAKDKTSFHTQCINSKKPKLGYVDVTEQFISSIFLELLLILDETDPIPVHKGNAKCWPNRVSDLLPYGADQLATTLLQWYRMLPDTQIIRLTLSILKVCGTLVYNAFTQSKIINLFFIDHTRKMADELIAIKSPTEFYEASQRFAFQSFTFTHFFKTVISMESIWRQAPDVNGRPAIPVMRGVETKAIQLCSLICYILSSPYIIKEPPFDEECPNSIMDAQAFATILFRWYRMDQAPCKSMPLHPFIVEYDRYISDARSAASISCHIIASAMYSRRFIYRCGGPTCRVCFTDPEAVLKTCIGCQTVRYCGKECQAKDWREGPYAHKKLCKIMAKIEQGYESLRGPTDSVQRVVADILTQGSVHRQAIVNGLVRGVVKAVRFATINDEEFNLVLEWATKDGDINWMANRDFKVPAEWDPGYDDYEDVVKRIMRSKIYHAETGELFLFRM
ncbi:hypothetical protein CVT24_000604 [Panaeolus cyanescens]|uniref:MYND-type domain-containing protein n=1 Tax=Panaeolus cyanescens TaxID=181874 RepID=A0A409YDG0_9AGAR|nr:hypothetical protein CVT24_000604 [Panaeolus cyanescens]